MNFDTRKCPVRCHPAVRMSPPTPGGDMHRQLLVKSCANPALRTRIGNSLMLPKRFELGHSRLRRTGYERKLFRGHAVHIETFRCDENVRERIAVARPGIKRTIIS